MKLSDNPCRRDCPKRSPTCHSSCQDYAAYKEKLNKENELIQKKKNERRRLDDAERVRKEKMKTEKGPRVQHSEVFCLLCIKNINIFDLFSQLKIISFFSYT